MSVSQKKWKSAEQVLTTITDSRSDGQQRLSDHHRLDQTIFPRCAATLSIWCVAERTHLYNIEKTAIWLDPPPIIGEDHDGGGVGGGHVESRSLGLLTSSCWHVTRVASWSRDLFATVPRDDDDALHFGRRAMLCSQSENHWLTRPVGTGSLGVGTKETAVKAEEGEEGKRDREGWRRVAGEERRRTVFEFLRTRRLFKRITWKFDDAPLFLFMGRLAKSKTRDNWTIVRQSLLPPPFSLYHDCAITEIL